MKFIIKGAQNADRHGRFDRRSGFTLIELLTVIAIIGMLGAISITTVRAAIESARTTQTQTTIAKIDNVLTAIYEKYQYRRVDLTEYPDPLPTPIDRAYARVRVMRDLLRCDMPCTTAEVDQRSLYNGGTTGYTPLQETYRFAHQKSIADYGELGGFHDNYNAELLYLVVMNGDPEARSNFADREVADTDGNGLYEFVDGWGKPICWMRWAPGLLASDRQPRCYANVDDIRIQNVPEDSDPFDPLCVFELNGHPEMQGWFLVPYVFSAGPDGEYGLIAPSTTDVSVMNDPFTSSRVDPTLAMGAPQSYVDESGETREDKRYKDNIDNHTLVR